MDLNVVPLDSEAPKLDAAEFVEAVLRVFPNAEVVSSVPPAEFVVRPLGQGQLSRGNTGFYYSGHLEDAARLAVEVRRLWPDGLNVIVFDDNFSFQVPLTSDTGAEELAAAVRAASG